MKFKTLLLGSAAAFVAAGGAQAADLSIAEPVDYVRVCDAFGTGYWYIPGTDTCLKIGGKVQFDIKFQKSGWGDYSAGTVGDDYTISVTAFGNVTQVFDTTTSTIFSVAFGSSILIDGYTYNGGHSTNWKFVTEASVNFTAKSMTEYGPLVGYVKFLGKYDGVDGATDVGVDEAYLSLGHVLFGYTGSAANFSDGYTPGPWHGDVTTNQIKLSWAAAGFGIQIGIEDPYKRWGTELPVYPDAYSMPDITGNITVSQGHWNAKIIAGWSELWDGGVYGVGGTLEATMDVFSLMVGGAFGTGNTYIGTQSLFPNYVNQWTAFIAGKWQATPTFSLAGSYAVAGSEWCPGDCLVTAGGVKLVWAPVAGFEAYAEAKAWKWEGEDEHDWEGKVGVARSW
jgi:hypothetical protein